VINADVLDAWFPPSPRAVRALADHLEWTLRTSPPTGCEGLVRAIARERGIPPAGVLPGAGSSDLLFLALREWVRPSSRVLLLDPTYGEYLHVLERVIGARPERLTLHRENGYALEPERLAAALGEGPDLAVLVNPNSPTGRHLPRAELEAVLAGAPPRTRVLIDETYVDYAGPGQSLESFAARSANVAVLKSLSKVYALSGARAAYLCAPPPLLEGLRALTPPWAVSLPGQIAAVMALGDRAYYAARWEETRNLRESLATGLSALGLECVPAVANFILCHLPPHAPPAASVVDRCRRQGLYLRDAGPMGTTLGDGALRIAVKDSGTNRRMLEILRRALE
jgi:histidinol-phosphate/aromatic aminotransferase/cobyric acid decarboxylase-like protein